MFLLGDTFAPLLQCKIKCGLLIVPDALAEACSYPNALWFSLSKHIYSLYKEMWENAQRSLVFTYLDNVDNV